MHANFDNVNYNVDYNIKPRTRLIVDQPTEMELLSIEMSMVMKPEADMPKQPPTLFKLESRPITYNRDHFYLG